MKISYYAANLAEVIGEPDFWPSWLRRAFRLTMPLSYLLWFATWAIFVWCAIILIFFLWPLEEAINLWADTHRKDP